MINSNKRNFSYSDRKLGLRERFDLTGCIAPTGQRI